MKTVRICGIEYSLEHLRRKRLGRYLKFNTHCSNQCNDEKDGETPMKKMLRLKRKNGQHPYIRRPIQSSMFDSSVHYSLREKGLMILNILRSAWLEMKNVYFSWHFHTRRRCEGFDIMIVWILRVRVVAITVLLPAITLPHLEIYQSTKEHSQTSWWRKLGLRSLEK